MAIEVNVAAIVEDEIFKTPIVVLKSLDGRKSLPIWVGPFEGQAIEYGVNGSQLLRPLPYDSFLNMIKSLGGEIKKIVITAMVNNTFHAVIITRKNDGTEFMTDSRPSDAISLAVRCGCSIFVNSKVFEEATTFYEGGPNILDKRNNVDKNKSINDIQPKDFL